MNAQYHVQVVSFEVLEELAGNWVSGDFVALLNLMEFDDINAISPEELRDMCLMSLQDQGPRGASALVLRHKLGDRLSAGELQNMSNEMLDEKLWEEHADMALHEALFNVGSLLYSAFPLTFPQPDAVRVRLEVRALDKTAESISSQPLLESFVVRLLSDGMDQNAVLHRIFGEQLAGSSFPEADKIVWTVASNPRGGDTLELEIVSSGYWIDSLRDTRAYESSAYADFQDESGD